ncbi:hypothetical protein G6011_02775 [Alternaria panax]|uniref:Uncharacterized protein n=1 Tax=Alternaria panax TaxID=48097 RepID=A0AAD4F9B2_9PLEO|nr:hypothetical protein G6011_02775 [Alternaria panax]
MENTRQARTGERTTTQFDTQASLIRRSLEEMSNTQTLLSSTRKELLIERERVYTAGREVRQKRIDAGNAEVKLMNCLREFFNKYLEQLPTTLHDCYNKVEQTRDDLGEAEENYLQADESLTGAVWTFMKQEDRFYQFGVNRILPDTHSEGPIPLYGQPLETGPRLPAHHLPPCPAGSLSPSQVSKLPSPPPPPLALLLSPLRSSLAPRATAIQSSPVCISQGHVAMMGEVDALKKELGHLWQKESYESAGAHQNEALFAEGNQISDTDMTSPRSEYSDILVDISSKEAKTEGFKIEDTDPVLDASTLTKRHSDSRYSSRASLILSVPMKRVRTESAAIFNRCTPAITKKIGEWSLTHLKGSVIQRRLYSNTLQDNGIEESGGRKLNDLATEFWSKDSLNETGDGSELHAASASRTGNEAQSLHDQSATQSITSSLLMQHRLDGNLQPFEETTVDQKSPGLHGLSGQSHEYPSQRPPLSPSASSYHQIADEVENNNGNKTPDPIVGILDEQRHLTKDGYLSKVVVNQPKCTCLADFGDAAQRKDSVQSTHQPGCAMAAKHVQHIMAHSSMRERKEVEKTTKTTRLDKHCDQTYQDHPVDLHAQYPSGSDHETDAFIQPDFDVTTQSTSPTPCPHFSKLPVTVKKESLRSTESLTTGNYRPIARGRRGTTSWVKSVKSVLSPSKYLRSKSTPSIGEYHI